MDQYDAVVVVEKQQDLIYRARRGAPLTILKGPNAKIYTDDLKYVKYQSCTIVVGGRNALSLSFTRGLYHSHPCVFLPLPLCLACYIAIVYPPYTSYLLCKEAMHCFPPILLEPVHLMIRV